MSVFPMFCHMGNIGSHSLNVLAQIHQKYLARSSYFFVFVVSLWSVSGLVNNVYASSATPLPPATINATKLSESSIKLEWSASTGATNYQIHIRYKSPGGFWNDWAYNLGDTDFNTNGATSITWTGLNGGTRNYIVKACIQDICSRDSPESGEIVNAGIETPTGLVATKLTERSNRLSWNTVSGATNYRISIQYTNLSGVTNNWKYVPGDNEYNTSNTSITWTGLNGGTRAYKVSACNQRDCSFDSNTSNDIANTGVIITPPGAPGQPTKNRFIGVNSNYRVSWAAPTTGDAVTSYELTVRNTENNKSWTYPTANTYQDLSHADYGWYNYTVKACNSAGCSSATAGQQSYLFTSPNFPQNLTVDNRSLVEGGKITLSWQKPGGIVPEGVYKIYETYNGGSEVFRDSTRSLSHSYTLSKPGTFQYKVKACNPGFACSSATLPGSITVTPLAPGVPGTPTIPVSYIKVGTNYQVSWSAPTTGGRVTGYKLSEYNEVTKATREYPVTGTSKTLNYTDYGRRFYQVKACNHDVCSDFSSQRSLVVYTQSNKPGNLEVDKNKVTEGTAIRLSWTTAGGLQPPGNYKVSVVRDGGAVQQLGTIPSSTLFFTHTPSTAGTYVYTVAACNPDVACSTASQTVVVTAQKPGVPGVPSVVNNYVKAGTEYVALLECTYHRWAGNGIQTF